MVNVEYGRIRISTLIVWVKSMDIRRLIKDSTLDSFTKLARSETDSVASLRRQLNPLDSFAELVRSQSDSLRDMVRAASISESFKAHSDAMARHHEVAERVRDSITGATEHMVKQIAEFNPPVMRTFELHHIPGPSYYVKAIEPPVVEPRLTATTEVLGRIKDELERRKAEVVGTNQQVCIKVTPPDGRPILAMTLAADGENMIVIDGHDFESNEKRSVTVGAAAFQVEYSTIDLPPPKPDLRLV